MASVMQMRFELTGLKDVLGRLAQFQKQGTRSRILRPALQAATKPMLDLARSTVRIRTGVLRKSLARKTKTYRKNGVVVVIIGPRKGFKKLATIKRGRNKGKKIYADPIRYAHLVEFGTYRTRAYPFLRPAFHRLKARAVAIMKAKIMEGIHKELARRRP